jgi:hypothetical protein
MYNLSIEEKKTTEVKAKVLSVPEPEFGNGIKVRPTNGAFTLQNKIFAKPATLNSLAVVDFSGNQLVCDELVGTVCQVAEEKHGILIPSITKTILRRLDNVTKRYEGRNMADDALSVIKCAIERARDAYICDSTGAFWEKHVWFETTCFLGDEEKIHKCLILPPASTSNYAGIMFDSSGDIGFTHYITTADGRKCNARLKVKIKEADTLIDPFDFRYNSDNGYNEAIYNNEWVSVGFNGYCYECSDGRVVEKQDIANSEFAHSERDWKIDCPDIMLVVLPDKGKALYDHVKFVSNQCSGVQTQCASLDTFNRQRNKEQYSTALATKMNAKLSTVEDGAIAWRGAVDWVNQCHTLVIGIGMAHGMGRGAETIVGISTCLDGQCFRLLHSAYVQKKADTLSKDAMIDLFTESWKGYCNANGNVEPCRILVYRDGMSDGNFTKADDEIDSIRAAIKKLKLKECECKSGCSVCCPPITYVICQSQHSIRIVPATDREGYPVKSGGVNVHSGTVVDHTITELGALKIQDDVPDDFIDQLKDKSKVLFPSSSASSSYDFLLTAQGGLKGTSKPMYYRVRLNENANWGPSKSNVTPLTKETLENCTYHMSYQYATAPKAVREVPVVKYAKRVASQVLR